MPSDLQTVLQLLPERHEMDGDALSNHIRDNFCGSLLSLRQLKPFVQEILRRFKCLPRKKSMDGTYPTISGHRTFKSWCGGVLHRSDRTVRYMLKGGNKKRKTSDGQVDTVSALDADAILKYLTKFVGKLHPQQKELLTEELRRLLYEVRKSLIAAPKNQDTRSPK